MRICGAGCPSRRFACVCLHCPCGRNDTAALAEEPISPSVADSQVTRLLCILPAQCTAWGSVTVPATLGTAPAFTFAPEAAFTIITPSLVDFAYYPYYPYAAYSPYAWYDDPFFYSDRESEDRDSYADAPYRSPADRASYSDDNGVQRDVQALSGKVDRLQADLEARNQPTLDKEPETALVFRDQHVEEVRNYAISGGMIWVFKEQAAKRIPLAQLDIPATVRRNDDRGVDFQVPEPALQIMIVR